MHPVQASKWKKEVTERLPEVFAGKSDADAAAAKAREQIGRLKLELEWLKKRLASSSVDQRRRMIEAGHPVLSVERQCELRGLSRATYYHRPRPEPEDNRRLMRLIDETYLAYPFFGSRQMTRWLHRQGERVNRKRVQRQVRQMGLEAICRKPNLSRAQPGHRVYP
jgi:putative transposase